MTISKEISLLHSGIQSIQARCYVHLVPPSFWRHILVNFEILPRGPNNVVVVVVVVVVLHLISSVEKSVLVPFNGSNGKR